MQTPQKRNTWLADQPLQRKIVLAIGALLFLFVATNLGNLISIGREQDSRDWASHTYDVLLTLADVSDAAHVRQAAARGYIVARKDDEYADFETADGDLSAHLANLRGLMTDNPLQESRLDRLQALLERWKTEAETMGLAPMPHRRCWQRCSLSSIQLVGARVCDS
ncbi:CHASE3 domain-containing protein [Luteibacter sp.]|jgi:CHASE3 domain sensor protein|uniref:CHASE3 domain-containing protein n=1 Tax=Luteibacter sp. TaxID=1886636 RepID=UPI002F407232